MLNTYQAELYKDKIKWIDKKPEDISNHHIYRVQIQILKNTDLKNEINDLVEFFQNSPLSEIDLNIDRAKDTSRKIEL